MRDSQKSRFDLLFMSKICLCVSHSFLSYPLALIFPSPPEKTPAILDCTLTPPISLLSVAHLGVSENTHAHALEGGEVGVRGPGQGLRGRCRKRGERERREPRYLTDNVIIVSQCTGMRDVRRGVAQFPYIWVGALSDGGQREIIIVLLRCRPVLTAGRRKME